MSRKANHIFLVIFVAYLCVVAYLCYGHISVGGHMPSSILGIPIDKVVHFVMFLPFAILAQLAFVRKDWYRCLAFIIISGIAAAFLMEYLQGVLTTYRCTDPKDMMANMTAITTGSVIMAVIGLFRKA